MEWSQWISYTATAFVSAAVSFGGGYFWFRRGLMNAKKEEDDNAVAGWKALMDFKSEDFRKKNQEQDARMVSMRLEMDKMHTAHLKCERDAMEREIAMKRESMEREFLLKQHETRIAELTDKIDLLQKTVATISQKQAVQEVKTSQLEQDASK